MENKYDLVVVSRNRDVLKNLSKCNSYLKYLSIKKVIFLGNGEGGIVNFPVIDNVEYINGEDIIPYEKIEQKMKEKNPDSIKRTGWYLQQFLKLYYSRICEDKYYIVWDSDCIPICKYDFFDKDGKPYFNTTVEYNKDYFDTLERLISGLKKNTEQSYISGHMVYNTQYTKELLNIIEENSQLKGDTFYEKIINAIDRKSLPYCGFSEFETYGTFVREKYPNSYMYREICIDRFTARYFTEENFDERSKEWMSSYCQLVCFEGWCKYSTFLHMIVSSRIIQNLFSATTIIEIIRKERCIRLEIKSHIKDLIRPLYKIIKGK